MIQKLHRSFVACNFVDPICLATVWCEQQMELLLPFIDEDTHNTWHSFRDETLRSQSKAGKHFFLE